MPQPLTKQSLVKQPNPPDPQPPSSIGKQTFSQAANKYLKTSSEAPQRKFLWILSSLAATAWGIVNKDKK